MVIADARWIRQESLYALMLALPISLLLLQFWRTQRHRVSQGRWRGLAAWLCGLLLLSYVGWFLNVTFEWSVFVMVGWPVAALALSFLGCGMSLAAESLPARLELLGANVLMLLLSGLSLVKPN